MKQEHTPGPWVASGPSDRPDFIGKKLKDGTIALIASLEESAFRERQAANAQLIKAAPDLLEAAKRMEQWFHSMIGLGKLKPNAELDALHQAISKAEIDEPPQFRVKAFHETGTVCTAGPVDSEAQAERILCQLMESGWATGGHIEHYIEGIGWAVYESE